jgi:hypothetical protein
MPQRRLNMRLLRKLARALLAFQTWLDGSAAAADEDSQAREARLLLRSAPRSRPSEVTCVYDSLGRVTQVIDAPTPPDWSLRLEDAGEVLVAARTDIFVFAPDAQGALHFVARRPSAPGAEGDRPS